MARDSTPQVIAEFVKQYETDLAHYETAARLCESYISSLLESSGIRAIVTSRAKRVASLRRKLLKRHREKNYQTLEDIARDIHDLAGVRIALYFPGDREPVRRLIREHFRVEKEKEFPESCRRVTNGYTPRFPGYCATHFRVFMRPEHLHPEQRRFAETQVEIQVATVLMHGWAEIEHDLVYKPAIRGLSRQEYAMLDQINGLVLASEIALENLESAIKAKVAEPDRQFSNHYELAVYLRAWFHGIGTSGGPALGRVDALFELLERSGLHSPRALQPYLQDLDLANRELSVSEQLLEKINGEGSNATSAAAGAIVAASAAGRAGGCRLEKHRVPDTSTRLP